MINERPCGNAEPHTFHSFEKDVTTRCYGIADCGIQNHDPHNFVKTINLWCSGVCDCGDLTHKGRHGPGAHK